MNDGVLRMRVFAFVAIALFCGLLARLWYLQGLPSQREEAERRAETNVLERVVEEAPRGRILDRNGTVIVDNEVVEVITIDRDVVDDLDPDIRDAMFEELAIAVSRAGRLTKVSDIVERYGDRSFGPFEPVPVAVDVNPELLVFLGERPDRFPGVEVVQRTVRSYPYGNVAAHLLGYVNSITREEWEARNALVDDHEEDAKPYELNHEIGKSGVELVFEDELRGVPGTRFLEVDASGSVVREKRALRSDPVPGNDVWLSIDIDLQALAEKELADGLTATRSRGRSNTGAGQPAITAPAGSLVALDPRTGDLLAMASAPTFDPAEFVNGISGTLFADLTSPDNYSPILNRTIQGAYAPGSTFKLITAVAALQEGVLGSGPDAIRSPDDFYVDRGTYTYSQCFQQSTTCEFTSPFDGTRSVDLSEAMKVSSDTYFYEIAGEGFFARSSEPGDDGLRPDEGIQKWAREFGLDIQSGIQLPFEQRGAVPDRDYYDAQFEAEVFAIDGSQWTAGNTINLSIGQGELLVTPLQLANTYATFGNGGSLHQPNVATKITSHDGAEIRTFGPRVLREVDIPDEFRQPIEQGLLGVTMDTDGTATRVFDNSDFNIWNWPVAGKTGTAEVADKADTSLFAAYGPVYRPGSTITPDTEPELAIAVVMEESGFGSSAAAPVAAAIFAHVANDTVPVAQRLDQVTFTLTGAES